MTLATQAWARMDPCFSFGDSGGKKYLVDMAVSGTDLRTDLPDWQSAAAMLGPQNWCQQLCLPGQTNDLDEWKTYPSIQAKRHN